MGKKKCCKSKKPCKDCPRNKKKKIDAGSLGIACSRSDDQHPVFLYRIMPMQPSLA